MRSRERQMGANMNAAWIPVRRVADILFPWRGGNRETSAAMLVRWLLHLTFWSMLLVALWQINRWSGLDRLLRSPWPMLHRAWLPLLAVAVYPLGWLGLGLWSALQRAPTAEVEPDVSAAWTEARSALEQAGIDVVATPAFLILGSMSSDLHALLESLGAAALSRRVAMPFQVFAHTRSIFFAVEGDAVPDQTSLNDLCQVLLRERAPRHPLQGIIVAVPFAVDALTSCRDILRAVRSATGLDLPIYFAICGLDAGIGSEPLFQRFPLLADLDPAEIVRTYEAGLDWLCLERIPQELRARIALEPAALPENIRLYRWQSTLASWRTRIETMLTEETQTEEAEPGMVAGCYIVPSPAHASELAAILQADLLKHQHSACWTAATVAEDDAQKRRVRLGYTLALLAVIVAMGSVVVWLVSRP
jgi:hypothetical protein